MAFFGTESKKVDVESTKSLIDNFTTQRESQRSDYGDNFNIHENVFVGFDVVGINTKMIPQMRQAIRKYVDDIYAHLDKVQTQTDPTIALKGTGMEGAVVEYITSVTNYCKALCSNLLAFSDKLVEVEEAWRQLDQDMSSKVQSGTSNLESFVGQTYHEQR